MPLTPAQTPPPVREIHRRLVREYGPLTPPRRWEPLEELILTILSQNTSDVNSDRAYASLRDRFPAWADAADARTSQVAAAIRPGGLANVKAPRILAVLREIRQREGGFDLSWMRDATDREVEEYLSSLPGVGPKTVACVLAFSLGRPVIPVDTHVHRVATRLGVIPPGMSATRAHVVLSDLIPRRLRIPMHVAFIRHGRTLCKAGRPRCEECPLQDLCPTAPSVLGGAGKRMGAGRTAALLAFALLCETLRVGVPAGAFLILGDAASTAGDVPDPERAMPWTSEPARARRSVLETSSPVVRR